MGTGRKSSGEKEGGREKRRRDVKETAKKTNVSDDREERKGHG